jgi:hypothetical protein
VQSTGYSWVNPRLERGAFRILIRYHEEGNAEHLRECRIQVDVVSEEVEYETVEATIG